VTLGIKRNIQPSICVMISAGIWSQRARCCLHYKEFSYIGWFTVHLAWLSNSYWFAYSHWERQGGKLWFWL